MQSTVDTWAEHSRQLRQRAAELPAGEERDRLVAQADQLDTAVDMTKMLAIRRPQRK
jgi:hypothetical protein